MKPCGHGCQGGITPKRHSRKAFGWLVPGLVLAILPKCPMCVATYVVLFTGIGISLPTAAFLRASLIVVCVGAPAFLTARWIFQRRSL